MNVKYLVSILVIFLRSDFKLTYVSLNDSKFDYDKMCDFTAFK